MTWLLRLGWAVALVALVAGGILLAKTKRLRKELAREGERVTSLSQDLEAERSWMKSLSAPGVRIASFTLTPAADARLRARAIVDPGSRRALLVFEGLRPPEGQIYALWGLRGNTAVPLGPVRSDPQGRAVMRIDDLADAADLSAFALSLEPVSGAPTAGSLPETGGPVAQPPSPAANEPTGPIVMIGALRG